MEAGDVLLQKRNNPVFLIKQERFDDVRVPVPQTGDKRALARERNENADCRYQSPLVREQAPSRVSGLGE